MNLSKFQWTLFAIIFTVAIMTSVGIAVYPNISDAIEAEADTDQCIGTKAEMKICEKLDNVTKNQEYIIDLLEDIYDMGS